MYFTGLTSIFKLVSSGDTQHEELAAKDRYPRISKNLILHKMRFKQKLHLYTQNGDIKQGDNKDMTQCFGLNVRYGQYKESLLLIELQMKKTIKTTLIILLILIGINETFAQSTEKKLNQVELMKQFLGTWKGEFGNNTFFKSENESFSNGIISNSQVTVDGKIVDSISQIYGYDSELDKFIIAELKKSSSNIELCLIWFNSDTTGEIIITNPENAPLSFKFEFKDSNTIEQTSIKDNNVVNTILLRKINE